MHLRRRLAALTIVLLSVLAAVPLAPAPAVAEQSPGDGAPLDPAFEAVAGRSDLTADHAVVFRLYWASFGRQPDADGATYWIAQRDSCVKLDVIADWFARSAEFAGRYGTVGDDDFIDLIYHNVLGRDGDPEGVAYWTDLLARRELTRGGVVLNVSLSAEFVGQHHYPSDGVRPRTCVLPDGSPAGRSIAMVRGEPLLTVGGLTLLSPSAMVERAGFHQSANRAAVDLAPAAGTTARITTLGSRGRGTSRTSAIDIVSEPNTPITAPIAGTVVRGGAYRLYCRYDDGFVVIRPDARPDLEVKLLHIRNVSVRPGQRVEAGDLVAAHASTFPFRSQVDDLTAEPSWPHVHIEVIDSTRGTSGSGSC